jgi:hypothetical protein
MSKLLAPNPSWIGRPEGPEQADAVPPGTRHGSPHKLRDDLVALRSVGFPAGSAPRGVRRR